jgi:hypothetical protein
MFQCQLVEKVEHFYNHSLGEMDEAQLSRRLGALGLPVGVDPELLGFLGGVYMGIGWTAGVFLTYRRTDGPWSKQEQ